MKIESKIEKYLNEGTTGYVLFNQDDSMYPATLFAEKILKIKDDDYDNETALFHLALNNPKKFSKLIGPFDESSVEKVLRDEIKSIDKFLEVAKSFTDDDDYDIIEDLSSSNDYNPWPINFTTPILLYYVCGLKIPKKFIKAFEIWYDFQVASKADKRFLKNFEIFLSEAKANKITTKALGTYGNTFDFSREENKKIKNILDKFGMKSW